MHGMVSMASNARICMGRMDCAVCTIVLKGQTAQPLQILNLLDSQDQSLQSCIGAARFVNPRRHEVAWAVIVGAQTRGGLGATARAPTAI